MNESKADIVIKACELNRKEQGKYFFSRTPTRGPTITHTGKDTNTQAGRQTDRHTRELFDVRGNAWKAYVPCSFLTRITLALTLALLLVLVLPTLTLALALGTRPQATTTEAAVVPMRSAC